MADEQKATKTLQASETIAVAKVEKHGTALTIPENMTYAQAITLIQRRMTHDEEKVNVCRTFDAFPWDGAVALNAVLTERYGWAQALATPGFFGPEPPVMLTVETGYGKTVQVPWGRFRIPGVEGDLYSGTQEKRGRKVFSLTAQLKRKFEGEVEKLYSEVAEYLATHSIYRGQAFSLDFGRLSDDGVVEPQFLDVATVDPEGLIFSDIVRDGIETNVFTPIVRYSDLKRAGMPFKRGVLLTGKFGVGKTLAARVAAYHAQSNGVTFIDCPKAENLAQAVEFGRVYQPAVIFCEDIDREIEGERTASMDTLLNIVDGVDSKNTEIMIVLTTNAVEKINPAMIRPGRLDAVIDVTPPDAKAVQALLRLYGKGVIDESEDLTEVGHILDGRIPAIIAEVVKRSKLAALKNTPRGNHTVKVDSIALIEAATTMKMQLDLLYNRPSGPVVPTIDQAFKALMTNAAGDAVNDRAVDGESLVFKHKSTKFKTNGASTITFE